MGENLQQQGGLDGASALSSHRPTPTGAPPSSASSPSKAQKWCQYLTKIYMATGDMHFSGRGCKKLSLSCDCLKPSQSTALQGWQEVVAQCVSQMAGMHRHFILFGLMDHLERRLNQRFSPDEVLQLLDRFFNLELLKPDEDDMELVNHEEEFSLPSSIYEESKVESPPT